MGTLAVHWGWLDTVPGFPDRLRENPPQQVDNALGRPAESNIAADYRSRALSLGRAPSSGGFDPP